MKRVLLVIPNLDFGGAQNAFWRLSLLLSDRATLQLVTFNRSGLALQPYKGDLLDLGVPGSATWIGKLYWLIQRVVRLRRLKRDFRPDVSISFLEGADYVNLLSSVGERIVFYVHGSKVHDRNVSGFLGWIRKTFLIPAFYKRAAAILVVNKRLEEEYRTTFHLSSVPFHVFPNFYDFQQLQKLAEEPVGPGLENLFRNSQVICIMGRLAEEKGVDRFVRLMPALLRRQPRARLLLVGNGPDEEKVMSIARELKLRTTRANVDDVSLQQDASIIMMGYQPNPHRLLARSAILVLPSLNEGMPNSLVEAMGLGVPVAASNCPYGPAELLSPSAVPPVMWPLVAEQGILLPVLESEMAGNDWVEAIDKLIADSALQSRLAEAGRAFAYGFSSEKAGERWQKLLDDSL